MAHTGQYMLDPLSWWSRTAAQGTTWLDRRESRHWDISASKAHQICRICGALVSLAGEKRPGVAYVVNFLSWPTMSRSSVISQNGTFSGMRSGCFTRLPPGGGGFQDTKAG